MSRRGVCTRTVSPSAGRSGTDAALPPRCPICATRRLGRQAAADAFRTGQGLTNDEAAALASRLGSTSGAGEARTPAQALLSPREREVVTLITRGLTNRQIADALVIGERTVHTHVANVMAKLELSSRTQIAAWGVERGIC